MEDQRQGGAPAAQRGRTTLPVIFARRENVRRAEDGPASSRGRGHRGALRCGLPACGCGPADLVAVPRPEGSRPAGRGRPPAPESARCPPTPSSAGTVLAAAHAVPRCSRVLASEHGQGRTALACRRRALEAVEKVVTAARQVAASASSPRRCLLATTANCAYCQHEGPGGQHG